MKINSDKVKSLCHKLSEQTGVQFNLLLLHYFLESILEKISCSEENENFVFKGGFLLASIVGVSRRNTTDLDFITRRFALTRDNIKQKFEKILQADHDNGITYEITNITDIRAQDKYGGFRLKVLCKLENIKQVVPIDIATGDPITPSDIAYEYKSIFSGELFDIRSYNLETILAEKIHAISELGTINSRSKDFYDVYILYRLKRSEIDLNILKKACQRTFAHREKIFEANDIIQDLISFKAEDYLNVVWKSYQQKNNYAKDLSFEEVLDAAIELFELIR